MDRFDYVPTFVDWQQNSTYRLEGYTVQADGFVLAHFGDGQIRRSVYPTLAALLDAGRSDWRELVHCVKP